MSERTIAATRIIVRCKRPGCKNEARALGLCQSDYAAAYRAVEVEKEATWDELLRAGKVDPKRPSAKSWLLDFKK